MMEKIGAFGTLRAMLEQRPSTSCFHSILALLDFHDRHDLHGEVRQQWLLYAAQKLEHGWPDATRQCPKALLEEYERGEAVWCGLVRTLDFEGERLNKKRVAQMLAATHMGEITHVSLRSCYIQWPDLVELSQNSPFGQLDAFDFYKSSKLGDAERASLASIFSSPMLRSLRALCLKDMRTFKAADYDMLVEHLPLDELIELNLDGGKAVISPRRFGELLDTGKFDRLEHLSFDNEGSFNMNKGMLEVLAKRLSLCHLRTLTISGCHAKDFKAFAVADHFEELHTLKLSHINDAYEEFMTWARTATLPSLTHLELHFDDVGLAKGWSSRKDEMLRELATVPLIAQLGSLSLSFEHGLPDMALLFERSEARQNLATLERFAWRVEHHRTSSAQRGEYIAKTMSALASAPFSKLRALSTNFMWFDVSGHEGALGVISEAPWFAGLDSFQLYGCMFAASELFAMTSNVNGSSLRKLGFSTSTNKKRWESLLDGVDCSRLEVLDCVEMTWQSLVELGRALKNDASFLPSLRRVNLPRAHAEGDDISFEVEARQLLTSEPRWIAIDAAMGDGVWL